MVKPGVNRLESLCGGKCLMTSLTILMLPSKTYPCSHAMLETVYTRILPQRGHTVSWVMQSSDSRNIMDWELAEWNGTRVYLVQENRGNVLQSPFGRFCSQFRVVQHIMKTEKIDIVQVRNDWAAGLIGAHVKRRYGVPFVFQVSFPIPEMAILGDGGGAVRGRFLWAVRHLLLRDASLVLPISHWMEQEFREKEGIAAEKMLSFPLGADTSVRPEDVSGQEVRQRRGLGNDPTVVYFGEMDRIRRLDFLLRVMKRVIEQCHDAKLLMVGKSERSSEDVKWLESQATELGIAESVIFTGWIPRSEVPAYIAASDVGVSPYVPLSVYMTASPTKLMELMAMAKPVVANDIPEQKMILEDSGAGICTPYDEAAFADGILWLFQHSSEAKRMGQRGRKYIEEHRSYEVLATRVEARYQKLLNR
jgi:glycosyltransferase involved in cell wall biosynthesis